MVTHPIIIFVSIDHYEWLIHFGWFFSHVSFNAFYNDAGTCIGSLKRNIVGC